MIGPYFFHNTELKPIEQATVSIDNLAFVYGYGVYENLKVRKRVLYFPELHAERLLNSARAIGMKNDLTVQKIKKALLELCKTVQQDSFNLKILLMGNEPKGEFYAFALNPRFVTDKEYRNGVTVVTHHGERMFPEAKTLNMLMSFLAYKKAQEQGAYDALLVDNKGCVREGTRTNLFFTDGKMLFTPPNVLEGVTKTTLIEALKKKGISVKVKELPLKEIKKFRLFLTSTSSNVLPISKIDGITVEIFPIVRDVMKIYGGYLKEYEKKEKRV